MMIGLGILGGAAILDIGVWFYVVCNVEQPKYALVTQDAVIELRDYPALVVAEVTRRGDRNTAVGAGFGPLAGYIFANNGGGDSASMTAPMLQDRQTIAMTGRPLRVPQNYLMLSIGRTSVGGSQLLAPDDNSNSLSLSVRSVYFIRRLMPGADTCRSAAAPAIVPVIMMARITSIWRSVMLGRPGGAINRSLLYFADIAVVAALPVFDGLGKTSQSWTANATPNSNPAAASL